MKYTHWVYRNVYIMPLHIIHDDLKRLFSVCSTRLKVSAIVLSDVNSFTNATKKLQNGNHLQPQLASEKRFQITP